MKQFLISIIELIPMFLEIKNIPVEIIAIGLGIPSLFVSVLFFAIKKIKYIYSSI